MTMQEPAATAYGAGGENGTGTAPAVSSEWMGRLYEVLERDDAAAVRELVCSLHEADQAEMFNQLDPQDSVRVAEMLGEVFNHDVLPELEPEVVEDVLEGLGKERSAEVIAALEREDAVQIIEDLPDEERQEILQTVDEDTREELEEGLSYPEESAGRLMRKKMVTVPSYWTVGDTIDHLRAREGDLPEDFYVVFVVDPKFHLVGEVQLARVMRSRREVYIQDIMNPQVQTITTTTDQEEVAYLFRKFWLVEAPVVNAVGRLVGTITVDDVVEVISEEQEEDILRAAGVYGQELRAGILEVAPRRFTWLFINLLTAIAASGIINMFQQTIQHLVALAVLMPIIASMGGNAGIQSATVAVRALATRRLGPGSGLPMMIREMLMGGINGVALAIITGVTIYFIYQDLMIALVFAAAIIVTMTIAGLGGVFLPLLLTRLKVDPAISAGVFLTMLTDMVGFFAFLGLASLVL